MGRIQFGQEKCVYFREGHFLTLPRNLLENRLKRNKEFLIGLVEPLLNRFSYEKYQFI